MQVGDLVHMPGSIEPATGIVLRTERPERIEYGFTRIGGTERPAIRRVEIYWIQEGEVSWEPVKWLEVLNERG